MKVIFCLLVVTVALVMNDVTAQDQYGITIVSKGDDPLFGLVYLPDVQISGANPTRTAWKQTQYKIHGNDGGATGGSVTWELQWGVTFNQYQADQKKFPVSGSIQNSNLGTEWDFTYENDVAAFNQNQAPQHNIEPSDIKFVPANNIPQPDKNGFNLVLTLGGAPAAARPAYPAIEQTWTTHPTYKVALGDYQAGEIVDWGSVTHTSPNIIFRGLNRYAKVTYSGRGNWEPIQYSEESFEAVAVSTALVGTMAPCTKLRPGGCPGHEKCWHPTTFPAGFCIPNWLPTTEFCSTGSVKIKCPAKKHCQSPLKILKSTLKVPGFDIYPGFCWPPTLPSSLGEDALISNPAPATPTPSRRVASEDCEGCPNTTNNGTNNANVYIVVGGGVAAGFVVIAAVIKRKRKKRAEFWRIQTAIDASDP